MGRHRGGPRSRGEGPTPRPRPRHPVLGWVCTVALLPIFLASITADPAAAAGTGGVSIYAGISLLVGIAAGPDGALWFTSNRNATIGRITTTGTITTYS